MANHTGVSVIVKVGSNTVAELRSFTIDTTAELIEDTTLTDSSRTYQVGKKALLFRQNAGGMKLIRMGKSLL